MTNTELRLFIKANDIEMSVFEDDAIIFLDFHQLAPFCKLVGVSSLDEGGIPCRLKDGYIGMEIGDLCDEHGFHFSELINIS